MREPVIALAAGFGVLLVIDIRRLVRLGDLGDHTRLLVDAVRKATLLLLSAGSAILTSWAVFWIVLAAYHGLGFIAKGYTWYFTRHRALVVNSGVVTRVRCQRARFVLHDMVLIVCLLVAGGVLELP